jgi:hypothetical protein
MIVQIDTLTKLPVPIRPFRNAAGVKIVEDDGSSHDRLHTMYIGEDAELPAEGSFAEAQSGEGAFARDLIYVGEVNLAGIANRELRLVVAQSLAEQANQQLENAKRRVAEVARLCAHAHYFDLTLEAAATKGEAALSSISLEALGRLGVVTIGDLLEYSYEDLLYYLGDDEGSVAAEARSWLKNLGLQLAPTRLAEAD